MNIENDFNHKHMCMFYDSRKGLFELIVPFFKEGIRNNELCVWVVPDTVDLNYARSILRGAIENFDFFIDKRQFELYASKEFYLKLGEFIPDDILIKWGEKVEAALDLGFNGVCASGELPASWDLEWDKVAYYESKVDEAIKKTKIKALCTYSLDKFILIDMLMVSAWHGLACKNQDSRLQILKK